MATWFNNLFKNKKEQEDKPGLNTVVAARDSVVAVVRPDGIEKPVGRILRRVEVDGSTIRFVFLGFEVEVVAPAAVLVQEVED